MEIELLAALKNDINIVLSEIKIQEEEMSYFSIDYPIQKSHSHYLNHKSLQKKKNNLSMEFIKLIKMIESRFGPLIYN